MKKLLINESQLEIYLRDNPLGTSNVVQAKSALEETVKNLENLVSQDKLGKVHVCCTLQRKCTYPLNYNYYVQGVLFQRIHWRMHLISHSFV